VCLNALLGVASTPYSVLRPRQQKPDDDRPSKAGRGRGETGRANMAAPFQLRCVLGVPRLEKGNAGAFRALQVGSCACQMNRGSGTTTRFLFWRRPGNSKSHRLHTDEVNCQSTHRMQQRDLTRQSHLFIHRTSLACYQLTRERQSLDPTA
jgi:hypothetical protein